MKATVLVEVTKVDLKSGKAEYWCSVHDSYNACVRKATLTKSIDFWLTYLQAETETLFNDEQVWSDGKEGSFFYLCVMSRALHSSLYYLLAL
jgi:hypothetical protein